MNLRVLTPHDGAALYALWADGAEHDPAAFGSTREEFLSVDAAGFASRNLTAPERFTVLGAWLDDELCGFVAAGRDTRAKLRHSATIGPLYVSPKARRGGVGSALMAAAEQHLAQYPEIELLKLSVAITNLPARSLYQRCGFRAYGVEPRGMRLGDVAIDMELLWKPCGRG